MPRRSAGERPINCVSAVLLVCAHIRSRRGLTREIHALGDKAGVASYGLTYPDLFSGGSLVDSSFESDTENVEGQVSSA